MFSSGQLQAYTCVIIGLLCACYAGRAAAVGHISIRGKRRVERDKRPAEFWSTIVILLFAGVCTFIVGLKFFEMLSHVHG